MRPFFVAFFSVGLLSNLSLAAECIGNSICQTLGGIIETKTGMTLNNVLDQIDNQISFPIIESQEKLVLNEMSQIKITPRGTLKENETKLTLHLGGNFDSMKIKYTFFNETNFNEQFLGTQSSTFLLEHRINHNNDLIINIGYWNGSSDLGMNLLEVNTDEKNIKLSLGDRFFFVRNDIFGAYVLGAFSLGGRNFILSREGKTFQTKFNNYATWSGEEKYNEKIMYGSAPFIGGVYLSSYGLTLSMQYGLIPSFSTGKVTISKFGVIGPVFEDIGYFNVGVNSTKQTNNFVLFHHASAGIEYSFNNGMTISGEFRPKFENSPIGASIGIGWSF